MMNDEAPCQMLEWDSQFFGARIARVTRQQLKREQIASLLHWCAAQQVDCLYFLCAPDDEESVRVAEAHDFHFTDIRLELHWPAQAVRAAAALTIRPFQESDLAELQQIAATAYTDTRFYYDQHFSRARAAALYQTWITNSAHDDAQAVFVAQHQGGGGFITCQLEEQNIGRIGLIGVSAAARGHGYGHALVQTAQSYLHARGASEVRVVTQGRNIAAQRLYQAHGFRTRTLHLWYHKWFER